MMRDIMLQRPIRILFANDELYGLPPFIGGCAAGAYLWMDDGGVDSEGVCFCYGLTMLLRTACWDLDLRLPNQMVVEKAAEQVTQAGKGVAARRMRLKRTDSEKQASRPYKAGIMGRTHNPWDGADIAVHGMREERAESREHRGNAGDYGRRGILGTRNGTPVGSLDRGTHGFSPLRNPDPQFTRSSSSSFAADYA
jgi:hypothetical protein